MVAWTARPAVLMLGPSKHLPQPLHGPRKPMSCLGDFNAVRREQAGVVRRFATAILMEDEEPKEPENYTLKFRGLVKKHDVRSYSVLWPLHAQMNALDVEFGFLLTGLAERQLRPDNVHLFVERHRPDEVYREEAAGEVVLADAEADDEKGNRAFYYSDFAAFGCPVSFWSNKEALLLHTLAMAVAHAEKYPVDVTR